MNYNPTVTDEWGVYPRFEVNERVYIYIYIYIFFFFFLGGGGGRYVVL